MRAAEACLVFLTDPLIKLVSLLFQLKKINLHESEQEQRVARHQFSSPLSSSYLLLRRWKKITDMQRGCLTDQQVSDQKARESVEKYRDPSFIAHCQ